ncbi:MAG TPA: pyridoxal-dependent decarboxylase, partial [Chthoniobacterales bacterium]|nr:pyridoxal-dependent decarboxylase [Chthoniobacterales bacterium]
DPAPDQIREWGVAATDTVAKYLESLRDRRLYPITTSSAIRERLDPALPIEPQEFERLLAEFRDVILELSRHNGHPRMFGYVQSPGTALAAIADLLASAVNANLTAWRSAPVAVEIERLTINWIKQLIGYPADAAGLFVSGGSMANFAALAAARNVKAGAGLAREGMQTGHPRMCVYVSHETHHSIEKAAALLGIGRDNVRKIDVDSRRKIRIDRLVQTITSDISAGHQPFCVVGNAGTVMTGAVDPLTAISEVARKFGLWMHVDAAYGGFATLADSTRPLFAGIELADSVALDPHKWLYLPVDCGCVLYRDPAAARATFAHDAEYTRVIGREADEAFAFWDYGPELSRRFRALKVWMVLKGVGVQALGEAIENDLRCARHLERLVRESDDFEMLAPVELSIFCFRHVPAEFKRRLSATDPNDRDQLQQELDRWNEKLMVALQLDGSSYLSNALIDDRFALRGCVINYRTTQKDMEILLEDLRRVAAKL